MEGQAELEIIRRIRSRVGGASNASLRLGIGDDCALLRARSTDELAITTDLSVEGRHFRLGWHPPEAVGHRALARGLSDLAAMGARPVAAFLSLGLPKSLVQPVRPAGRGSRAKSWLDRFLSGFLALAEAHKTPLAGGDLAETPLAIADIVLVGTVPRGRALLRSGAQPGDRIYVTGRIGGAAAGLALIAKRTASKPPPLPHRSSAQLAPHLYPEPRVPQGMWLMRRHLASAAIDLSDGLSRDLAHICNESGVAAEIDADKLPIHPGATRNQALHGGEDYELLFTAPPTAHVPGVIAGAPVTAIGRIVSPQKGQAQAVLITAQAKHPLKAHGWEHFA